MITRRGFIGTAGAAFAAQGPLVWLNLNQKQLDDAYNQSVWAPNQAIVQGRGVSNSNIVRERIGEPKRFAYGPTPIEGLDVYTTSRASAPIVIYVHGGAWRGGRSKDFAFPAEMFVRAGAHYIALDFINVIEAGGSLAPMADQVRRAVAWVYRNASAFGGDSNRIYLTAHSSGSHLGGVVTITDWARMFGLPRDVVKGAVLASGIYDLKPVRLSARSSYVTFTDAIENDLSTLRHLDLLSCPLVLAYGTNESPEFIRQTRDFAAAVKAAGKPVELLVGQGYNHFEIEETFANPYGLLGRAALTQMKL